MSGVWSDVKLAGKHTEIYEPAGNARPRFGLLFLHPLGQETLRGRQAFAKVMDERNLVCVCPQGGRSWWADRICGEFDAKQTAEKHVLENVLPFFKERWGLSPRAIGIFGISMG